MDTANIIEPIVKTESDKKKKPEDEEYRDFLRLFGLKEDKDE